jgi:hypothetical protein
MSRPTKREQLAAMRLEEFRARLRTIVDGSSETISGAARPHPSLVRNRKKEANRRRR